MMEQVLYACLILLPVGISLRISLRLLYGARGPQAADPIYQIMNVLGWVMSLAPLVVLLIVGTTWLSWLLLLVAGIAGLEMVLARRAMQRHSAWALVSGALGSGKLGVQQPATEAFRRHQIRFTGIVGRVFRRLVTVLEQGSNLRTAISTHRDALPREAQAYAAIDAVNTAQPQHAGEKSALEFPGEGTFEGTSTLTWHPLLQRTGYIGTILVIMLGIVTFVMIQIVPSYQDIFNDFELDLPQITVGLITISNAIGSTQLFVVIMIGCVLAVLFGIFALILYLCDVPVLQPLTDRLFYTRHRSLVLKLLAVAVQRGQSFAGTIEQLTTDRPFYPSRLVRRRLRKVGRAISAGLDWKEALRRDSFIKQADIAMLDTAQSVDNLPWVLRTLADQKVRAMNYRWSAVEQIAFPCVIMLLGLLVMWICVALFVPLVNLINGLVG